ncbi:hypothetical protein HK103_006183 [Boothiomyces macroporosus]|uniref:EF hand family protein n=1 Tax=Boothiomyces macroporosus TaxID=261099 RepID=A0AAD5Y6U9_9FUNG|nr:hypothetical protein HK103_006183 [Boothiomyces macroporosus]
MNSAADGLPALPTSKLSKPSERVDNFERELLQVERKYSANIYAMRIRLIELFQDFDPLRSGLMSKTRFVRCISASLDRGYGHQLTPRELDIILQAYSSEDQRMIRWRDFVNNIDKVFGAGVPDNIDNYVRDLSDLTVLPFRRPLSPKSEVQLKEIIQKLIAYNKHHGADPKSWFCDFDKNSKGWVNYNQFRRGMPQNLISSAEEDLLLARYGDPQTGTVNYFKLHTDVTRKPPKVAATGSHLVAKNKPDDFTDEHIPIGTEEVFNTTHHSKSHLVSAIEDRIKQYVYRNRIRLIEFFRDYDRHNCGLVTQTQFATGIRLARLPIDTNEVDVLLKSYGTLDGRANYRKLCASIDTVFTINNLEQNPLQEVKPPSKDWLIQSCNRLEPHEEQQCNQIIARLQTIVKERRILIAPLFKDFDRFLGNLGRVSRSHFSRLLVMMGMNISDEDLHILFRKYEDHEEGRINYQEFIKRIDPETYRAYHVKNEELDTSNSDTGRIKSARKREIQVDDVIKMLQDHVVSKRIRISEFFRDFDKLRSYSIRKEEFVRGISKIGYDLNETEMDTLCNFYKDPKINGYCLWKRFADVIDEVFVASNLESNPSYVHNEQPTRSPFQSTGVKLSAREEEICAKVLENIRHQMKFRKANVKPFFRDCDKICSGIGHVTKSQFRQCLTFMECNVTEEEFEILCKKWMKIGAHSDLNTKEYNYINDVGQNICYFLFLQEIEKGLETQEKQLQSEPKLKRNPKVNNPVVFSHTDFEKLMMKIRMKAKTERIRVIDFMLDFDHLRHGKISRNEFRRAIKVVFGDATEGDLKLLEDHYSDGKGSVYYVKFSDDVESVFTKKGLEKDPTSQPEVFDIYSNGWETDTDANILAPEDEVVLKAVMKRLRDRALQRRVDALAYMEDYDFVKEGTITTSQFRSVLNQMNLGVSDKEFAVITQYFATNHSLTRLNYRRLANYGDMLSA